MRTLKFNVPDSLFVSSTIVTDIKQNGDEVTLIGEKFTEDVGKEWKGDFVTSDVASLTNFERMIEIASAIRKAKDDRFGPWEILFRIAGKNLDTLSVLFRQKKKLWS